MSEECMVEKVARAITRSQGGHITGPSRHRASDEFEWDAGHTYMEKYVEKHWRENINAAHFAIGAMKDVPLDALGAMYEAMFEDKWDCSQAPMVGAGWDAAIGYMLNEKA